MEWEAEKGWRPPAIFTVKLEAPARGSERTDQCGHETGFLELR